MTDFATALSATLSVCRVTIDQNGSLLGGMALTGLIGSLTHCVGMCGPFVISQGVAYLDCVPAAHMREFHRIRGALLVPYHLGRGLTYASLGALAALLTGSLAGPFFRLAAAVLLLLAALFLLGMAVPSLWAGRSGGSSAWGTVVTRWAKPLFSAPTGWRGLALGLVLGLLPCGLVYAALAVAASSGQALAGAMAMMAFWAGTVPMLVAVGVAGHFALSRWRQPMMQWAPLLLVLNAGVLGAMAVQLLI